MGGFYGAEAFQFLPASSSLSLSAPIGVFSEGRKAIRRVRNGEWENRKNPQ
jgi:hypothetical protein